MQLADRLSQSRSIVTRLSISLRPKSTIIRSAERSTNEGMNRLYQTKMCNLKNRFGIFFSAFFLSIKKIKTQRQKFKVNFLLKPIARNSKIRKIKSCGFFRLFSAERFHIIVSTTESSGQLAG